MCRTIGSNQVMVCPGAQIISFMYIRLSSLRIRPQCYDLITQIATLGLRLENELGVRGRKCTID